jgi:glycolate oxidase FAD binding subunit
MGAIFSGGGKVIKNVTGYDLPKLMAGSMGTLAVLTEVTLKVLPAPRGSLTLALEGLDTDLALLAMRAALNSAMVVSGAAHLPREVLQDFAPTMPRDRAWTLLRLEGLPVSLTERAQRLADLLTPFGSFVPAAFDCSPVWKAMDDVYPFAQKAIVWRVSLPPSLASAFLAALPHTLEARWYLNWGGGLIWLFLDASPDGHAASVRGALDRTAGREGHATLMRAPDAVRHHVSIFQPLTPEVAALSGRIKSGFDPDHILNPGRLYANL